VPWTSRGKALGASPSPRQLARRPRVSRAFSRLGVADEPRAGRDGLRQGPTLSAKGRELFEASLDKYGGLETPPTLERPPPTQKRERHPVDPETRTRPYTPPH
jgi:hypothetical protein